MIKASFKMSSFSLQFAGLLLCSVAGFAFSFAVPAAKAKPAMKAVPKALNLVLIAPGRVPEIVVAPEAVASEKFAARELSEYLGKISGQKVPITFSTGLPVQRPLIVLGHHPANANLHPEKLGMEDSVVSIESDRIRIVGGLQAPVDLGKDKGGNDQIFVNDRGTLYGAYDLLDSLGVRWYRPEPWGEFVPKLTTVRLKIGLRKTSPTYKYRQGMNSYRWWSDESLEQRQQARLWATRNRQNTNMWTDIEYGGYYIINFDHNYQYLVPNAQYYPTHPEYFALIDGKRSNEVNAQLCLGNKEVQDLVAQKIIEQAKQHPEQEIASLEPNDGHLWCQCPLCTAMDDPGQISAATGNVSKANRVCAFNNIVAKKVAAAVPNLKLGWLAYNQHTEVPSLVKSLEPNTVVRAAAYAGAYSDYSHDLRDPASGQNARFLKILEGYGKMAPLSVYEYWSGYAWFGPLPVTHVMVDRLREYRKLNVTGVYLEAHPSWGPQGIDLYMFTRLLWNPDLDVQKELDLYYQNYYGPAAAPMKAYHELIEKKSQGGPIYYGGGYNLHQLFSDELVKELGKPMGAARQLAQGKAPYEQRVAGAWAGYEFVRLLRVAFNLRGQTKLMEAAKAFNDVETFVQSFKEGDVFDNGPVMYPSIANYLHEFSQDLKAQTALLEKFDNPRVIADYSKSWHFQTDAQDTGLKANWQAPDMDDKAWPLLDADRWWQEQGYQNYHGIAWYRRGVDAPDFKHGQRVILYFGAVDGDATVYVNGKEVTRRDLGANGDGWDKPFSADITDAMNAEGPSQVTVRVKKDNFMAGIYKGVQLLVVDSVR